MLLHFVNMLTKKFTFFIHALLHSSKLDEIKKFQGSFTSRGLSQKLIHEIQGVLFPANQP
jgi:hypothetical protein